MPSLESSSAPTPRQADPAPETGAVAQLKQPTPPRGCPAIKVPSGSNYRILLLTLGLILILVLSIEAYYRHLGCWPSVVDNQVFWAIHRNQVYEKDGKKRLVIVGASRSQLGLVPEVLEAEFPGYKVVHLAIDGVISYEVVRDLCQDKNFNGIILWDAVAYHILPVPQSRQDKRYVDYYHKEFKKFAALEKRFNTAVAAWLQSKFVVLAPDMNLNSLVMGKFHPKPNYTHMLYDRYRPAFYHARMTTAELVNHRKIRLDRRIAGGSAPLNSKNFQVTVTGDLKSLYGQLKARGGELVLLQMPTTDRHWAMDEADAPKAKFWDRIQPLSGVTTVHFIDYPELSSFECPDTSHLDGQDAPEFTKRVAGIIKSRLKSCIIDR